MQSYTSVLITSRPFNLCSASRASQYIESLVSFDFRNLRLRNTSL